MSVQWEEPPASAYVSGIGTKPGRYVQLAQELRANVGKWAKLPDGEGRTPKGAAGTAQNIRRGKVKGFEQGTFETAIDGAEVWVRCTDAAGETVAQTATRRRPAVTSNGGTDAATVRAWAQAQGLEVPDRGRLPKELFELYELERQTAAEGDGQEPEVRREEDAEEEYDDDEVSPTVAARLAARRAETAP